MSQASEEMFDVWRLAAVGIDVETSVLLYFVGVECWPMCLRCFILMLSGPVEFLFMLLGLDQL